MIARFLVARLLLRAVRFDCRRDYAILILLARLGLRAREIVTLRLEDFDWRAGEVVIHGKGRHDERLPLPADMGEAVVGYLPRPRSTAGHLLWAGILAPDQEAAVAERLLSPDPFSGRGAAHPWRIEPRLPAVSYHGRTTPPSRSPASPFAGFRDEASTLAAAPIEAAQHFAHRLPELFSGFDRRAFGFPVPYPTACSPQA